MDEYKTLPNRHESLILHIKSGKSGVRWMIQQLTRTLKNFQKN